MTAQQNQVLGRGMLYFDPFTPGTLIGTGEKYLGNTPAFRMLRTTSLLDHFGSDHAIRNKTRSVTIQDDIAAVFTTDNVNGDNLANWFGGDKGVAPQLSAAGVSETINVYRDRSYQIGKISTRPTGLRNLSNLSVKIGAATYDPSNYDVDLALGRLYIHDDAASVNDSGAATALVLTYDILAAARESVTVAGKSIPGSLRFLAVNPAGENRDYFIPYVKLVPNGDYLLKGDNWQEMSFSVQVIQNYGSIEIGTRGVKGFSANELQALTYGTPDQIIDWGNSLYNTTNIQEPALGLPHQ